MSTTPTSILPSLPHPDAPAEASTPDADSAPVAESSRWRRVLVFVLMAGGGAVVGLLMGGRLDGPLVEDWTPATVALLAAGLPVGLLLIVALHEGGHTLAGYLTGFRLQHLSVGPLKLQRTPGGWKASRSQNGFFEGMSHGVPGPALQDAPDRKVRRARAVRLAGGAAANVLSGLLAMGVAASLPAGGGGTAAAGLQLFGIASMAVGAVNLVPFRTGSGLITDGARLLPLLRGTPEAGRDVALATVRAEAYGGTRPRDWSADTVERMLTPRDHGMTDGSTRMLAYRHALDAGRTEEARNHLAEALDLLDHLPKAQHAGLMVEAAYFEAAHRDDAEVARAWLERLEPSPPGVPDCAFGRAEAATLLAEGARDEAHRRISEAEAALDEHPVPGTAVAERAWLKKLAERVQECVR
jgi:hypothetical protein